MKVGILVTIISGFGKKGFYHSQEVGLGKALCELGHNVTVYKGIAKDQRQDDMIVNEHLRVKYIPMQALGVHGYLKTDVLDPTLDGLLSFSDTQIFLPHVYRYCEEHRICFVPYIGIAHSAQRNAKSVLMDLFYAMGTRKFYRRIPVLVKTDAVKEEMVQQGVMNCIVTPVGLDESELKTDYRNHDRLALRKKYGYEAEDVIVSFVGRLKTEKRPLDMLDIFDDVKDAKPFKLLIVGDGYLYDDVVAKVKRLGLDNRVQMIRQVPYADMWEIHYISDYFVNLCLREIFGMALLEGIYYGSSAAAAEAPGPNFILKDLPGHVLCKDDEGIRQWLRAEKPAQQTLDMSAGTLMRRVSWNNCAKAFEDRIRAYQKKLSDRRKGRT